MVLFTGNAFGVDQNNWPTRPIRIIVAFAPGSFTDLAARAVGRELTEQLNQQVVIENRLGAGGTLGTQIAAKATPDGHTLLIYDNSFAIWKNLYTSLSFDPEKDFSQVSLVAESPSMLVIRNSLPIKNLQELVDLAISSPNRFTYGTAGQGSTAHLASELFSGVAGIKLTHVPFKGVSLAIADTMAGRIDISIAGLASGLSQVKAQLLHGLAVSGKKRSDLLPEIPTFSEAGFPKYQMMHIWGLAIPANAPKKVIEKLNVELAVTLNKARLQELFVSQGAMATPSSSIELSKRINKEIVMWEAVIKQNQLKVD